MSETFSDAEEFEVLDSDPEPVFIPTILCDETMQEIAREQFREDLAHYDSSLGKNIRAKIEYEIVDGSGFTFLHACDFIPAIDNYRVKLQPYIRELRAKEIISFHEKIKAWLNANGFTYRDDETCFKVILSTSNHS